MEDFMEYKYHIIMGLLCFIILQNCNDSSTSDVNKNFDKINKKIQLHDSLHNERLLESERRIKLDLLKSERRIVLDEYILDKPDADTKQYESKSDSLIKELE